VECGDVPEAHVVEQGLVRGDVDLGIGLRLELYLAHLLLEAERAASGVNVGLDVGALQGDFIWTDVERGDRGGHGERDHQHQGHRGGPKPAAHPHEGGSGDGREDQRPLEGKPDFLIDEVDADQKRAVLVIDHFVARQKEADRHGEEQHHSGAAQEARLQAALEPEERRVQLAGVADLREAVAELPTARCDPIEQDAKDHDAQHVAAHHEVKREVEEIEGERLVKYRVLPTGGEG
jgi:hypothetical protein